MDKSTKGARLMTDQEILDNAPEGATHIDGEYDFCKDGSYFGYSSKQWIPSEFIVESRSLADIKRIAELEKELDVEYVPMDDRQLVYLTVDDLKRIKLEQQAKGVNDFKEWVLDTDENSSGLDVRDISLIEFYVEPLIRQAKALKEQSE
jgi:hypothetical protein